MNKPRKPDIILVMAFIFVIGVLVSNYTQSSPKPQEVANELLAQR